MGSLSIQATPSHYRLPARETPESPVLVLSVFFPVSLFKISLQGWGKEG